MYSNFGSTGCFGFMGIPAVSDLQRARFPLGQHSGQLPAQQRSQCKNQSCHVPALSWHWGRLAALGKAGFLPLRCPRKKNDLGEGRSVLLLETEEKAVPPLSMHTVTQAVF